MVSGLLAVLDLPDRCRPAPLERKGKLLIFPLSQMVLFIFTTKYKGGSHGRNSKNVEEFLDALYEQ